MITSFFFAQFMEGEVSARIRTGVRRSALTMGILIKCAFYGRFYIECLAQSGFYQDMWDPDLFSSLSLFYSQTFEEFSLKLLKVKQKDLAIK